MSMTDQPIPTLVASEGDPTHVLCVELTERLRAAAVGSTGLDMPEEMALIMTAAAMFAGTIYGTMVAVGIETDTRPKRLREAGELVVRNFCTGVEVGKMRAERIEREMFGGPQ
jgi:hypothetical protein